MLPAAIFAVLLYSVSASAVAQAYPAKAIEIVVPANTGAGSDVFARLIVDIMRKEKLVSQPLVITNKGGGGGAVAAVYARRSRGTPTS